MVGSRFRGLTWKGLRPDWIAVRVGEQYLSAGGARGLGERWVGWAGGVTAAAAVVVVVAGGHAQTYWRSSSMPVRTISSRYGVCTSSSGPSRCQDASAHPLRTDDGAVKW